LGRCGSSGLEYQGIEAVQGTAMISIEQFRWESYQFRLAVELAVPGLPERTQSGRKKMLRALRGLKLAWKEDAGNRVCKVLGGRLKHRNQI